MDSHKRKKLYDEWQSIVAEKLPLIYMALPEKIVALKNKFGNINPTSYAGILHNIEQIYVK